MTSHDEWLDKLPDHPFDIARTWLVVGSAGAGKSFVIRKTIDDLIERGVKPSEIMYILFNKAPADEFKSVYYAKGYEGEDLRWWGTHHGVMRRALKIPSAKILCGKTLVAWGKEHGFDLSSGKGKGKTDWDMIFGSLSAKLYKKDHNFSVLEQKLLSALDETEVREQKWTHVRYLVSGCGRRVLPPGIRYIFVDEAQDNGKVQIDWLASMAERDDILGLMLAGDDKQAINLFKGSDPTLFLDFKTDRKVVLRTTRRCPLNVLKEANRVISPVRKRSPLSDSSMQPDGMIQRGCTLDNVATALRKELVAGRNVLALTRDNFTKSKLVRKAFSLGLVVDTPAMVAIKQSIQALMRVKNTGKITDIDLMHIVPQGRGDGQLKRSAYWLKGVAKQLEEGDFKDDPAMLEAYKLARQTDGLPLEDAEMLGFLPSFAKDVKSWNIPLENWNLSRQASMAYKRLVTDAGWGHGVLRASTIHSVKGMEEDNVLVCTDISARTRREEIENPDGERRVWYVAMTRAKNNLFIAQVDVTNRQTEFIL